MRIALDIRYHTASGASNYITNLLPHLVRLNTAYELVLIRFDDQLEHRNLNLESITCRRTGAIAHVIWDQLRLSRVLDRAAIDLYHPLKLLGAMFCRCKQLRVGHSITSAFRGSFPTSKKASLYWIVLGNRLYRRSTHVVAVSEFVRDFLVEGLSIPESRVTVVFNGKDERFRDIDDPVQPPSLTLTVQQPFLLGVGNMFPVKNHLTTVRAFAKLATTFPDHALVFAGSTRHAYFDSVRQAVVDAGLADRVHFAGFVDTDALLYLYNRADLLLMPSLTEGCPITLLEAMACGLPVIGANRGGIPELGGNAIRLVDDPHDVDGWATAIQQILQDPSLHARLVDESKKRAAQFTWERAATETLAVYDALLGNNAS